MQKYFVKKIVGDIVSFIEQDDVHITKVMRLNVGDNIIAIDNNSKKFKCSITSLSPVRARILEQIYEDTTNNFCLNVYQASIKSNHMEIAIAKACELNVTNFFIFESNLSQKNYNHNLERYKRIIKESSEQSNRNKMMNIELINSSEDLLNLLNKNDFNVIAEVYENNNRTMFEQSQSFNNIGVVIGPEGGFNQNDIEFFLKIKSKKEFLNLTKTILRSETALIYLVSVVSYFMLRGK